MLLQEVRRKTRVEIERVLDIFGRDRRPRACTRGTRGELEANTKTSPTGYTSECQAGWGGYCSMIAARSLTHER